MGELFIGMDCGGTRTRAVLGDGAARILARATAGPGNPCSAGQEVALRSHELAIDRVLRAAAVEPERVRGVCLGAYRSILAMNPPTADRRAVSRCTR